MLRSVYGYCETEEARERIKAHAISIYGRMMMLYCNSQIDDDSQPQAISWISQLMNASAEVDDYVVKVAFSPVTDDLDIKDITKQLNTLYQLRDELYFIN